MKVFKFGGASIKDATNIRNVAKIIKSESYNKLVVVISAMGKMTNAFEAIVSSYHLKKEDLAETIDVVKQYHYIVIDELFDSKAAIIHKKIENLFSNLAVFLQQNKSTDYDYIYDQIVIFGELLSTTIVSDYLKSIGISNIWQDAREIIQTDNSYRNAVVNWEKTFNKINNKINKNTLYITQGFIGSADKNTSTTLGREGSDYSAAIITYCLNAESLTIWKDVKGVYNADPRYFNNTILLEQLSYREALEMAFYGASIIHPKTIKPLENKNIPFFVKSFVDYKSSGTKIVKGVNISPKAACYIQKKNQILLSIATKDFSFIMENNISHIFKVLSKYKIKVNLIQNSAISFSVCIEDQYSLFSKLYNELSEHYDINFNKKVKLITIRHFNKNDVKTFVSNNKVLLTQQTSKTAQFIVS